MRCAIGRLRHEERARDLLGGQAAEQPQRQRDARLGRQHRVAGGEDQPQQIVADVVVERGVEIGAAISLLGLQLAAELLVLALDAACARRQLVDARGASRSPSARRPGCPARPLAASCSSAATSASCASSSASADVAHHARQAGDEPRRLDAEDRVDRPDGCRRPSPRDQSIFRRRRKRRGTLLGSVSSEGGAGSGRADRRVTVAASCRRCRIFRLGPRAWSVGPPSCAPS